MFEDCTIAALAHDGLIYLFESKDIVPHLMNKESDNAGWFFNSSHDRYCAEWDWLTNYIQVNPSIVSSIFGMPVLKED